MKKFIRIILLVITVCAVASCTDVKDISTTDMSIDIKYPKDVDVVKVKSEQIVFTNLTSGEKTSYTRGESLKLPEGLYDCSYSADIVFRSVSGEESADVDGRLSGKTENMEVTGDVLNMSMETFLSTDKDDFIFEEIFFGGTLRPSGSQYYGDGYIKIFNNTDHVLYADGLAFCESKFKSTLYFKYSPDIRKDTMTIWSMYVVPGNGTDNPVLPGHSLTICDTGIDHRKANPNSFDHSAEDFEWYDISTAPSHMDIDSETVPNMDKWYCYTLSFYVMHNRGFTSFALARIPKGITKKQYLKDYFYTYNYTMYLPAGTFYMEQSAYKLPNSWIVDGVNCSVESKRLWNLLPPSVDAGWTHDGYVDKDRGRYFRSIRRKLLYLNADGTMHLKDTDNSTEDFNTECIPSIIEEQGTAISADGTKATTHTYDGVTPKN